MLYLNIASLILVMEHLAQGRLGREYNKIEILWLRTVQIPMFGFGVLPKNSLCFFLQTFIVDFFFLSVLITFPFLSSTIVFSCAF